MILALLVDDDDDDNPDSISDGVEELGDGGGRVAIINKKERERENTCTKEIKKKKIETCLTKQKK